MNVILKLNIVTIKDGKKESNTKYVKLGDTLIFNQDEQIESIQLDDIKTIITAKDCK